MPDKKNRQRPTQLHFYVNDQELDLINQKMALYGTENMSAYLRKIAIDGYVLKLELPRTAAFANCGQHARHAGGRIIPTGDFFFTKKQKAHAGCLHSTVTDFARLRGLSMSQPLSSAT